MRFEDVLAGAPQTEVISRFDDGGVREGALVYQGRRVAIRDGIPRFVDGGTYADNFGLQWTKFQLTQLDSHTGLPLTAARFWGSTHWHPDELRGRWVLEAGSGAGRFTEILVAAGARVVSCDLSQAVEANFRNNRGKGELLVFRADLYDLPFKDGFFDFVFCYGVLQHLPDPEAAYRGLFAKLKPGGRISIDYYRKPSRPSPWSTPKYYWHPLTRTLPPEALLRAVRLYVPRLLPFDTALKQSGSLGTLVAACLRLPCWNYHSLTLSAGQKVEWAVMDTFDALGARYDLPKTPQEVYELVSLPEAVAVEVFPGSNGVVANSCRAGGDPAAARPRVLTLEAALAAAVRLHREGRLDEAEQAYRSIRCHQPELPVLWLNLATLALQGGRSAQAAARCRRALALAPANAALLAGGVRVFAATGQEAASADCERRRQLLAPG
jgi:SAM-dependent methyltransferase